MPFGPPSGGFIKCGSSSNPDIGCSNSDSDAAAAYTQALLWYITGNQTYAQNAITILKGRFWNFVGRLNDNFGTLGYFIIGLFAISWIISIAIYK